MMHSGSSATGLTGLLMSLGGRLALDSGTEALPSDGRFSKLFNQLLQTPEGAERLSQALSQARLDPQSAMPESLSGELSEQDWQQLEAAWQAWQQQADQPLPLMGQSLPANVADLLQQVRDGQALVESTSVTPPVATPASGLAGEAVTTEYALGTAQSADTAAVGAVGVAAKENTQVPKQSGDDLGLSVLARAQSPVTEAGTTPAAMADSTSREVGALAEPHPRIRSGLDMSAKLDSATTQPTAVETESSADESEAISSDRERLASLQPRERSEGERSMGESGIQALEIQGARQSATSTAPVAAQAVTTSSIAADEAVTFNDPLIEDAFELQEKRELNQLRGDERLRERLDLGADRQGWSVALGSRIVAMITEEVQQARIQLDPPELGSMEIRLQVQQEQTSIQVQVQSPQVREALESNAHRLREALADNGLTLAGFDVTEQGSQQGGQHNENGDGQRQPEWIADNEGDESGSAVTAQATQLSSDSILDTFA
ncbi:hypothetical protein GCM10011297_11130 [Bacterioplanes sanyensis]|uniref:flagellar hook-length control protein FliK n=1 Tax=Bacterioplanes sanyensis TaxID=1249553 RepID=UPI0016776C37|nr:flagellar hook-length control protein FliK [Bacterioplanes sanyensis]GGY39689.1 hypothetical protein GCM10011297_11130 [Bacterioplanes sanyensis]